MINELLPSGVVAVEAFCDDPDEQVFPGEEAQIAGAAPGRRHEFITARRCARAALVKLGFPPAPIGRGPGREPLWPRGVVGTITHCTGYRAAVVTTRLASVGIDAEPNEALPPGVAAQIVAPGESEMLAEFAGVNPSVHWGRLLFSAKESVYKAWYPMTGQWLGFEDAALDINPSAGTFRARLTGGVDGIASTLLAEFEGRFLATESIILTAVSVKRSQWTKSPRC